MILRISYGIVIITMACAVIQWKWCVTKSPVIIIYYYYWEVMGSNPGRVIPKILKMVLAAFRGSTLKERSRGVNMGRYQWTKPPAVVLSAFSKPVA